MQLIAGTVALQCKLGYAAETNGALFCVQAAARSHAAREAELNSREAALEAAQQQLEQQSRQLQVRAA
jgi:hypothetical protein